MNLGIQDQEDPPHHPPQPIQPQIRVVPQADFASCQKLPVDQYGGDPVDFVDFMTDYFMYASAYGWAERTMIQRLPLYLKGAAREAYNQIDRREIIQWAAMKDALSEKLISGDVGRIIRQKFFTRTQKSGESVSDFAYHLSTLAEKAFGSKAEWPAQTRKVVEDQFLKGVHHHISAALSLADYANYDELIKKAMRVEMNSTSINRQSVTYTTGSDLVTMGKIERPSSTKSLVDDNSESQKTWVKTRHSSINDSPRNQQLVTCFKCNRIGHYANQCKFSFSSANPPKSSSNSNSPILKRRDSPVRDNRTCFACGKYGHITRDCRSRTLTKSPQRDTVNIHGHIKCFSCGNFGHIARSCPLNTSKFQQSTPKKKVKFQDDQSSVNLTQTEHQNQWESEISIIRDKLERWIERIGGEEGQNLMIELNKLLEWRNECKNSSFRNIVEDSDAKKFKQWKTEMENCMIHFEEISRKIWKTVADSRNLWRVSENGSELCSIMSSQILRSKVVDSGFMKTMTEMLDSVADKCEGRCFEIFVENWVGDLIKVKLNSFSKVRDIRNQIARDVPLTFLNQFLRDDEYVMIYGIVPESNAVVKMEKRCTREWKNSGEIIKQMSIILKEEPLNFTELIEILEIVKENISMFRNLSELINLLVPHIERGLPINLNFRSIFLMKIKGQKV